MGQKVFDYNGGNGELFRVPNGVSIINVTMYGAAASGKQGGRIEGKIRVQDNDVLWVKTGQNGRPRSGRNPGAAAPGGGAAGGKGGPNGAGGEGGGGAAIIRRNGWDGPLVAVAGGAGGAAGGGGQGGAGGDLYGGPGERSPGPGAVGSATGGTQNQGGKGGTSSQGTALYGGDAQDIKAGNGGRGGSRETVGNTDGGGGGGGGYYAGGGGQAGFPGGPPSGGGGGGSNWAGGLFSVTSNRGGGLAGSHAYVRFNWEDPGGNTPPVPPVNITINGKQIEDGLATLATTSVVVKGTPNDPNHQQNVRMYIKMSGDPTFGEFREFRGTYDPVEQRDVVTLTGLRVNKRYYLRIHTEDQTGRKSPNYTATNFWTNRLPLPPTQIAPAENVEITPLMNVTFKWKHNDPDGPADNQTGFQLAWRPMGTPATPPGPWHLDQAHMTTAEEWVVDAGTFSGHTFYEWIVRTRDTAGNWSPFSNESSVYVEATSQPPLLIFPTNNAAIPLNTTDYFQWKYRSPSSAVQAKADIRWRPAGGSDLDWTVLAGDTNTPGSSPFWPTNTGLFDIEDLSAGQRYEWQARTYAVAGAQASDWSQSGFFYVVESLGSGAGMFDLSTGRPAAPLGQGINRVMVYERGGKRLLGEITNMSMIRWNRQRDDISGCTLVVDQWDKDGKAFLGRLRTWMHELVIYRDNGEEMSRVWEGPITRISGSAEKVEIEAKDVMAYVYRRIMRQGYNDSYNVINGIQTGQKTVVRRASQILMNCLAYDDPNVLAYVTAMHDPFDAKTSRVVKDYTKTAWEEIDDLAATAGLDYVTLGRRIILWDTHRPIGRLPEMRDGHFSDPPIVSEYGMSAANVFAVTNNNGLYGIQHAAGFNPYGVIPPQGFIEQLASDYNTDGTGGDTDALTRAQQAAKVANLTAQAKRNIAGRWPPPLVARVPDNATLSPDVNLTINQLVPGVWIPLRASGGVREVSQWQKLDSITVEQTKDGEKIGVVMSPAPQAGEDPDADAAAVEET